MGWLWAMGAVLFVLAGLMVVSAIGVFRGEQPQDGGGAGRLMAMAGLAIGATLLGLVGLVFVVTANSDSFGR